MDLNEIKVTVIQLTDLKTNDRRVQLGVWAVFMSLFIPLEKQTNSLKLGSIYRIFRRILITKIVSFNINLNTGHKRDRRDHIDGNKCLSSLCCYSFARFSIIFPCNKLHKPSTPTAACSRVLAWRILGSEQPGHCCCGVPQSWTRLKQLSSGSSTPIQGCCFSVSLSISPMFLKFFMVAAIIYL